MKENKEITISPSTLETVDFAVNNWILDELNITAETNEGRIKVPLIWLTSERAFLIKNNKEIREQDSNSLVYPLMTIIRTGAERTVAGERVVPGNLYPIAGRKKNPFMVNTKVMQKKSSEFANANSQRLYKQQNFPFKNENIVYETSFIPYPVFLNMYYKIELKTDYIQQLNQMLLPFKTHTGGINQFLIYHEGHRYEAFIDDSYQIDTNASNLGQDRKEFSTEFELKVLGYITSNGLNQETPDIVKRESPAKVYVKNEYVLKGEIE